MELAYNIPQPSFPTLSVIMPVYNGAMTIVESLDSVFAQTSQPDEIIVVDDGSTDNTMDLVAGYGNKITVIKQKNKGHASARNLGIEQASGEFIAFLDADDIWASDKLEAQLHETDYADVIYTGVRNFGDCDRVSTQTFKNGKCVKGDHLCALLLDNFITHSSVMVRRDSVLAVGGYDTSFRTAPDWDLWLRMAEADMRFLGIPEPRTLYRWVPDSTSKDHQRTCKDRLRVVTNALDRADNSRVDNTVRKRALKNVWLTSAWFAANDRPRDAMKWYLRALSIQPTSGQAWVELIRTALQPYNTSGN